MSKIKMQLLSRVDTRGDLPPTNLLPRAREESTVWENTQHLLVQSFGRRIGSLTLHREAGIFVVQGMQLKEDCRGQGFGLAALTIAVAVCHERRVSLATDPNGICGNELPLWQHLAETGVATEEVAPENRGADGCHGEYYSGRFVAAPSEELSVLMRPSLTLITSIS